MTVTVLQENWNFWRCFFVLYLPMSWPSSTLNACSLSLMCCIADYKFQMSFIPLFSFQSMERFLYANLILVHISKRQWGWIGKPVQIHPGKTKACIFFPRRSLSSKKEKKMLVEISQMNEINVLMFHFCHSDSMKQEGNKDRSSDPWIMLCPAASAATAGRSAGERALSSISLD